MRKADGAGTIERIGTGLDSIKLWFSKAWQMGIMMAKGAYLLTERRRLFGKLGEDVYERILKGELQSPDLEPLVHQLDRLTKKVEIEEILIRKLRYGKSSTRPRDSARESSRDGAEGSVTRVSAPPLPNDSTDELK